MGGEALALLWTQLLGGPRGRKSGLPYPPPSAAGKCWEEPGLCPHFFPDRRQVARSDILTLDPPILRKTKVMILSSPRDRSTPHAQGKGKTSGCSGGRRKERGRHWL